MGSVAGEARIFEAEHFRTTKEWVYFCVEFDLEICCGCHLRARRRVCPGDGEVAPAFYCDRCTPKLHPDLWRALSERRNVATRCDLCGLATDLKSCWISEDCRRVYCSAHLEPVRVEDRYRMSRQYLQRWFTPSVRRSRLVPRRGADRGASRPRIQAVEP